MTFLTYPTMTLFISNSKTHEDFFLNSKFYRFLKMTLVGWLSRVCISQYKLTFLPIDLNFFHWPWLCYLKDLNKVSM